MTKNEKTQENYKDVVEARRKYVAECKAKEAKQGKKKVKDNGEPLLSRYF